VENFNVTNLTSKMHAEIFFLGVMNEIYTIAVGNAEFRVKDV